MEPITFVDTSKLNMGVEAMRMQMQLSLANEGILQNFLPRLFKDAYNSFNDFVKSEKFNTKELTVMVDKEKKSLAQIRSMDYSLIRKRSLQTMEGFTGSYLDYSGEILVGLGFYDQVLDQALRTYKVLLGELLTNKSAQLSMKELAIDTRIQEAQEKSQAKYWMRASHETTVTVGDVVSSMGEIASLYENMEKIAKKVKDQPLDNIQARVAEINSLINLMAEAIQSKELEDISRTQITNLSEGVLNLAQAVEHYAMQCYRAQFFISAVKRLDMVLAGE